MDKHFIYGLFLMGLIACDASLPSVPESETVLAEPIDGLTPAQTRQHLIGDELFAKVYTPDEGLGPIFIQTSCEGCHVGDGKGHPSNMVRRFGTYKNGIFDSLVEFGGPQQQYRAISNYLDEKIPSQATVVSERTAPVNTGLGFLDALDDSTLIRLANTSYSDASISGRLNWVEPTPYFTPTAEHIDSSGYYIGRFGKKAVKVTLQDQIAFALQQDMGLSNDLELDDLFNIEMGRNQSDNISDPEVSVNVINSLEFYLRTLKSPTRRYENDADVANGEKLFAEIGCGNCHKPTLKTGWSEVEALNQKEFHPFTDLLLHDMGDGLKDDYPEGNASGREWRTAPLWGLGLAPDSQGGTGHYLHDGRAKTLLSAIQMHASNGSEANSTISNFYSLTESQRVQIIKFLESL